MFLRKLFSIAILMLISSNLLGMEKREEKKEERQKIVIPLQEGKVEEQEGAYITFIGKDIEIKIPTLILTTISGTIKAQVASAMQENKYKIFLNKEPHEFSKETIILFVATLPYLYKIPPILLMHGKKEQQQIMKIMNLFLQNIKNRFPSKSLNDLLLNSNYTLELLELTDYLKIESLQKAIFEILPMLIAKHKEAQQAAKDIFEENKMRGLIEAIDEKYKYLQIQVQEQKILNYNKTVFSVTFSPDGKKFAIAAGYSADIFDVQSKQLLTKFNYNAKVFAVTFSPDGKLIAIGSYDGAAQIYDLATKEMLFKIQHAGGVVSIAFSSNGKLIATGSYDGTAQVHDIESGQQLLMVQYSGHFNAVRVAFSPDNKLLAIGSDNGAQIYDIGSKALLFYPMKGTNTKVAFNREGKWILAASQNILRVYDIASKSFLFELKFDEAISSIAFNTHGDLLTIGAINIAFLYDIKNKKILSSIRFSDQINSQSFSPDDKLLLIGIFDGSVFLLHIGLYDLTPEQKFAVGIVVAMAHYKKLHELDKNGWIYKQLFSLPDYIKKRLKELYGIKIKQMTQFAAPAA